MQSKDDMEWSFMMQKYAVQHYKRIWPEAKIIENDIMEDQLARYLDIAGTDKIVILESDNIIQIAQRFRRIRNGKAPDFSLRYMNGDYKSEFFKLRQAVYSYASYPRLYAFGYAYSNAVEDDLGFERFIIFYTEKLVKGIADNIILYAGPYLNNDGYTSGIYIRLTDIPRDYVFYDYIKPRIRVIKEVNV